MKVVSGSLQVRNLFAMSGVYERMMGGSPADLIVVGGSADDAPGLTRRGGASKSTSTVSKPLWRSLSA